MIQKILAFGFMLSMSLNVWATVTVVDSGSTTCGESPSFSGQDCTI